MPRTLSILSIVSLGFAKTQPEFVKASISSTLQNIKSKNEKLEAQKQPNSFVDQLIMIKRSEIDGIRENYNNVAQEVRNILDEVDTEYWNIHSRDGLSNKERFAVEAALTINELAQDIIPDAIEQTGEANEDIVYSAIDNFGLEVEEDDNYEDTTWEDPGHEVEPDYPEEPVVAEEPKYMDEMDWRELEFYAKAFFQGEHGISGVIEIFKRKYDYLTYWSDISGLENGGHVFYVHEFGDVTNNCENVGERYNPIWNNRDIYARIYSENGVQVDNDFYDRLANDNVNILGRSIVIQLKPEGDPALAPEIGDRACASIVQVANFL